MTRNEKIIRTSYMGVGANVLLAAFKAGVGLASGSIAILMDAVNNLTDVLSSVVTIVGARLSARPADREHPFGHGRIEYFAAIIIAIIVLMAGMASMIESVKKILHPTLPQYDTIMLVVIVVAIVVKILLGTYVRRTGHELRSDALIASGADSLFDAVVTLSTLVSAIIMLLWQVNLDGWFGGLISLVILKAGLEMLASPINELLGSHVPREFVTNLKREVMSFDQVLGIYDIIMNNYGPDTYIGSIHVNVPDTMTAREIHRLTREITLRIYEKFGAVVTVGIYAVSRGDSTEGRLQHDVMQMAAHCAHVTQVHGYYYYEDQQLITIDVVPDDEVTDNDAFARTMSETLHSAFPHQRFSIVVDRNYSE